LPFVSLLSFLYYNIFCQKNQPLLYQYNCYYEKTGSEVKNITDEIPFDIPDTWCFTRFSSLILINGGYAFKSENYIGKENGVRVLRISDFNEKGFNQKRPIYHKYTPELKPFELEVNDIIMCMTGGTVGKSYFVSELPEPMLVNQRVADIKINDILNKKYCYHFILSPYIQRIIDESKNSTNDNISVALINSFIVPVPPLAEQERIVAEIEKFEPLIAEYDKLEQQATKLDGEIYDKLKKSILQYAIQGKLVPQNSNDEPAAVLLERIRAEKKAQLGKKYVESYIYKGDDNCYYEHINGKDVDITEERLIDIPDNWQWRRIENLFFVTKLAGFEYTNYFTKSAIAQTNEVPIVRAQNVKMNKFIENTQEFISLELSELLTRSSLTKDCLLMTFIGAEIGDTCLYSTPKRHHLAPNVAKLEPYSKEINLRYCLYWLMSPVGQQCVSSIKKMTAQPSLSMETIRSIFIAVPPLAEQKRIVDKIDEIFAKL
jgi:putative type I restriction enzyme specificity protein